MPIYFTQILLCLLIFSGCVPLRFIFGKATNAKGVVFEAPPSPYQYIKKKPWDGFWSHPKSGHSIAFFSNCSRSVALTDLAQFKQEILGDLKNFKVSLQKKQQHRKQPAYYLQLTESRKASHLTKTKKLYMELFIFKKRTCFYVLNLLISAAGSSTKKAQKTFQQFIKGFRAP